MSAAGRARQVTAGPAVRDQLLNLSIFCILSSAGCSFDQYFLNQCGSVKVCGALSNQQSASLFYFGYFYLLLVTSSFFSQTISALN